VEYVFEPTPLTLVQIMSKRVLLILSLCVSNVICIAFGLWVRTRIQVAIAHNEAVTANIEQGIPLDSIEPNESHVEHHSHSIAGEIIALIWIAGLQGGLTWTIINRIDDIVPAQTAAQTDQNLMAAKELIRTRDAIIFGLAKLAESRDPETGQHLERISLYSVKFASALRNHPNYRNEVTSSFVRMIGISSVLHDIGKVGVEDAVLLKPGDLSDDERKSIQTHTLVGSDCIRQIERRLGNSQFLKMSRDIALSHHEWWNGEGYPQKLQGYQIPLAARIVSIADVYDALSTKRVYKDAYSHEVCVSKIQEGAGSQFDPELVKIFMTIENEFELIGNRFRDTEEKTTMSPKQEQLLESVMVPAKEELTEHAESVSGASSF